MSASIKILYAEDEPALGQIVKESLETRNFKVCLCKDGEDVLNLFENVQPDILVLDIMMPRLDGLSVAKILRKQHPALPIIFLTARSQVSDVIEGFKSGGNDYLKKPFSIEELIVRIKALLNRLQVQESVLEIGQFHFDINQQQLSIANRHITLTHREAVLLHELALKKNHLVERPYILKKIWQTDDFFAARSMDVFVTKLRKKLEADPSVQIINVRGYGYKLVG